jgi:hypothetical protein
MWVYSIDHTSEGPPPVLLSVHELKHFQSVKESFQKRAYAHWVFSRDDVSEGPAPFFSFKKDDKFSLILSKTEHFCAVLATQTYYCAEVLTLSTQEHRSSLCLLYFSSKARLSWMILKYVSSHDRPDL